MRARIYESAYALLVAGTGSFILLDVNYCFYSLIFSSIFMNVPGLNKQAKAPWYLWTEIYHGVFLVGLFFAVNDFERYKVILALLSFTLAALNVCLNELKIVRWHEAQSTEPA